MKLIIAKKTRKYYGAKFINSSNTMTDKCHLLDENTYNKNETKKKYICLIHTVIIFKGLRLSCDEI